MKVLAWILGFLAVVIGGILFLIVVNNKQLKSYVFGSIKYRGDVQMSPGNVNIPIERKLHWKSKSAFGDSIIKIIADKPITDEMLLKKGITIRILLARLALKQGIPEVNRILRKLTVWGNCGSSWQMNPLGDYDFPLTNLTTILWMFGEQESIIYPETKKYLLDVILSEDGSNFSYTVPKTLGLVMETENHMLMTEGSRYLKNRWIREHGNLNDYYHNEKNGMEEKLLSLMGEMNRNGLYEFNSLPYIGYTITALLNLEAYASEKVRAEARNVLDYLNWSYALNSYHLKHYPPMRRRYEKASITELTTDYHSAFMKSWLSFSSIQNYDKNVGVATVHAMVGAIMPYRPADKVLEVLFNKEDGYFIRQGHGPKASPEISSAGKNFLISAGGVNRGRRSLIVSRPICLYLNDSSDDLSEIIHLAGPGNDFMLWNNTGVYENFACAARPVNIPEDFTTLSNNGNWSVYLKNGVTIVVYSTDSLGLFAVFEGMDPPSIFERVLKENPDPEVLKNRFKFPNGPLLELDVFAEKHQWVMVAKDGEKLNRDFDSWPLIQGDL
ncbi:MAG: hypothetical protein JXQ96_12900 [Cyclobacteriaceae bacterium]